MLVLSGRPAQHPGHLRHRRPPSGDRQHEQNQVRGINIVRDGAGLLPLDDGGGLVAVVLAALVLIGHLAIEYQRLPPQQADQLGPLAVVVVDPSGVVPDVLGGERGHRHRLGHLRQLVAQHCREELLLAAEVVVHPLLIDSGLLRDPLDRRAIGTALGELRRRGLLDPAPGPLRVPRHDLSRTSSISNVEVAPRGRTVLR